MLTQSLKGWPVIRFSKVKRRFIKESYCGKGRPRDSDYGESDKEFMSKINDILNDFDSSPQNIYGRRNEI